MAAVKEHIEIKANLKENTYMAQTGMYMGHTHTVHLPNDP